MWFVLDRPTRRSPAAYRTGSIRSQNTTTMRILAVPLHPCIFKRSLKHSCVSLSR